MHLYVVDAVHEVHRRLYYGALSTLSLPVGASIVRSECLGFRCRVRGALHSQSLQFFVLSKLLLQRNSSASDTWSTDTWVEFRIFSLGPYHQIHVLLIN